ncbi:hypothetical protein KKB83_05100 [Patescibacteria group bacterium]|nr:hypothetical protein [Patescibacteria group bacterium]
MLVDGIIVKLEESGLTGRGGARFPTHLKWKMVKEAKAEKKYIICNAAEGEPGVFKDGYILKNYPQEVVQGIKLALGAIDNSTVAVSAYIYLRKDYYQRFKEELEKLTKSLPITLFKKTGGYLAGEETSLLEVIEGRRPAPRIKPPYPPQIGLFGYPTLVNNLETFYHVAQIAEGKYKKTRFYSISGEVANEGVYEFPEDYTVSQVLKETQNWPDFRFFIQSGGGASGEVLLPDELEQTVRGQGAIVVYNRQETDLFALMEKWVNFFLKSNCDKCVPCREGVYRLAEMIEKRKLDKEILDDILFVLEETSFCALGEGVVTPFRSLISKLRDGLGLKD